MLVAIFYSQNLMLSAVIIFFLKNLSLNKYG